VVKMIFDHALWCNHPDVAFVAQEGRFRCEVCEDFLCAPPDSGYSCDYCFWDVCQSCLDTYGKIPKKLPYL
jgi:hypothetical protein